MGAKSLKSRCVIKGNQEDTTNLATYAPPVSKETTMFITSLAAINKWKIEALDVEKAFLQSRVLKRPVFVNPPKKATGSDRLKIWKLKTAMYVLGDAAREWYLTVKQSLLSLGLKESKLEPSLFDKTSEPGNLEGILCLHVDDIFLAGNRHFKGIKEMLKAKKILGNKKEMNSYSAE